jgi:hypothetical protein
MGDTHKHLRSQYRPQGLTEPLVIKEPRQTSLKKLTICMADPGSRAV